MAGELNVLLTVLYFVLGRSALWCAAQNDPVFRLDCGASQNSTGDSGQVWQADTGTEYLSSGKGIAAFTSEKIPSVPAYVEVLLTTASIFTVQSSYSFMVGAGARVWIRLYFYPFNFATYDPSSAVFSVVVDSTFVLLSNVSIHDAIASDNSSVYLYKEFTVNAVAESVTVSFSPSAQPANAYAFVNALEVYVAPAGLISDDASEVGLNTPQPVGIPYSALETVYRVNVGGPLIEGGNDTLGRRWQSNESFLASPNADGAAPVSVSVNSIVYGGNSVTNFIAPPFVYSTALQLANSGDMYNLTWLFPVSASFLYMVRLHFCEIDGLTTTQRIFNVYLQNQTAYGNLDVYSVSGGADLPYYRDFIVNTTAVTTTGTTLRLQIGPTPNAATTNNNAILNGVEIFKLNNTKGSLDGMDPASLLLPADSRSRISAAIIAGSVVGGVVFVGLLALLLFFCMCRPKSMALIRPGSKSPVWLPLAVHGANNSTSIGSKTSNKSGTGSYISSAPSNLGRSFSFAEIQEATSNFDETLLLGVGGFGKVYRGDLEDGMKIAVKRGNPRSEQGITEFRTEIEMLSKLRHRHLVSLIGYCEEHSEMILVYEYMANGPLRSHLYGSNMPNLSWKQRLEICIGAARGLHYLHTGAAQGIIHRDVKTTNILLDENLVAKVSDFGLSKTGPSLDRTHVSTAVKGSFGYLDPEYFRRQQLTEKSDVYSFGVVLMEVLCARPAINPALPRDQVNIAEWAMHYQKMGALEQIIDPHLVGTINKESLNKFGETAEKCLADQGISRPAMGDVLWNLEYALQLQETAMSSNLDEDSGNRILELPLRIATGEQWEASTVNNSIGSEHESEDASASAVFSQLVKPLGR